MLPQFDGGRLGRLKLSSVRANSSTGLSVILSAADRVSRLLICFLCTFAGYSQYAPSMTGVFPHMSSAFSLFPPPFPTSSALPFGGLGSLGDGLLSSAAAAPAVDPATGINLSSLTVSLVNCDVSALTRLIPDENKSKYSAKVVRTSTGLRLSVVLQRTSLLFAQVLYGSLTRLAFCVCCQVEMS